MNNEENKPEAGQKVPDPIGESIERMQAVLEAVEHEVREARFLVTGMEFNQLRWETLSRACGRIHDLTRLGWQKLTEKPEVFHTPKEIIDFVTANPPLGEVKDAPTPLDPSAPSLAHGPWFAYKQEPDGVGIARHGNVIQAFAFQDGAGVQVFAKQVHADGMYADCWNVTGTIDCEKAIIATVFGGRNRMNKIAKFIRNGLLAARMRNRHYRMNRKARKEAANAERGDLCHED